MKGSVDNSSNFYVFQNAMFGSLDATFETQRSLRKVHFSCVFRARRNKNKVEKLRHKFSVLVLTGYSIGTRLDGGG